MEEVIYEVLTGKSLKKEEEGAEKKKKTKNRRT